MIQGNTAALSSNAKAVACEEILSSNLQRKLSHEIRSVQYRNLSVMILYPTQVNATTK